MFTASGATGTGRTGVGMGSVVEGTKAFGPGTGNGSGTTRAAAEGGDAGVWTGTGEGIRAGAGVQVGCRVGLGLAVGDERGVAVGAGVAVGLRRSGAAATAADGEPEERWSTATAAGTWGATVPLNSMPSRTPSATRPVAVCCTPQRRRESLGSAARRRPAEIITASRAVPRRRARCNTAWARPFCTRAFRPGRATSALSCRFCTTDIVHPTSIVPSLN